MKHSRRRPLANLDSCAQRQQLGSKRNLLTIRLDASHWRPLVTTRSPDINEFFVADVDVETASVGEMNSQVGHAQSPQDFGLDLTLNGITSGSAYGITVDAAMSSKDCFHRALSCVGN